MPRSSSRTGSSDLSDRFGNHYHQRRGRRGLYLSATCIDQFWSIVFYDRQQCHALLPERDHPISVTDSGTITTSGGAGGAFTFQQLVSINSGASFSTTVNNATLFFQNGIIRSQ